MKMSRFYLIYKRILIIKHYSVWSFTKKFYIVRFYEKPKGNNNCVEIYNKKGKKVKCVVIKDPVYNEGKMMRLLIISGK